MSSEETRYYLNGVYIHHVDGWTYRFVATDGHRCYYANVELPLASAEFPPKGIIIPRHAVALLAKLRSRKSEEPIRFTVYAPSASNSFDGWTDVGAPQISFDMGDVRLATKTIDGTFPQYQRIIPAEETLNHKFEASVSDLRRVIRSLAYGTTERCPGLRLQLGNGTLTISAKFRLNSFDGSFAIPAETTGPFEIGLNGHYLLGVLDTLKSERVLFRMSDPSAPVTAVDPVSAEMGVILMPMRVN